MHYAIIFTSPIVLAMVSLALISSLIIVTNKNITALHKSLTDQIKFSVTPKHLDMSENVKGLIALSIEIWKISKRINSVAPELKDNQISALNSSIQKLQKYLDRNDIEIIDHEGQKYNDGINLDVLSVEKDLSLKYPIIKETVEPSIIYKGNIVHKAKIILLSS